MNIQWKDKAVDEKVSQSGDRTGPGVRTSRFSLDMLCDLQQGIPPFLTLSFRVSQNREVHSDDHNCLFTLEFYDSRVL